jgi:hypothetical protein
MVFGRQCSAVHLIAHRTARRWLFLSPRPGNQHRIPAAPVRRSGRHADHPPDAEAIGEPAKARRPKGPRERHPDLTAIGEGGKPVLGFGRVGHR